MTTRSTRRPKARSQALAALLAVAAGPVNKTGKQAGKSVVDLATGKIYTATGSSATSTWVVSDGSAAITPA